LGLTKIPGAKEQAITKVSMQQLENDLIIQLRIADGIN
jgi:hypothetical protein